MANEKFHEKFKVVPKKMISWNKINLTFLGERGCYNIMAEETMPVQNNTHVLGLTWIIKECCQTRGVRKSNGRQIIISRRWQWGIWQLEVWPLRERPKVSQFPLSMQAALHTVAKRTGMNSLPAKTQSQTHTKKVKNISWISFCDETTCVPLG